MLALHHSVFELLWIKLGFQAPSFLRVYLQKFDLSYPQAAWGGLGLNESLEWEISEAWKDLGAGLEAYPILIRLKRYLLLIEYMQNKNLQIKTVF